MASTAPAKSQPLHNFTLPHLKWNKDSQTGSPHQRRRSIQSPSRRLTASSASPVRQSPLRESISETPPRHQSPICDLSVPQSPRELPLRECARKAPIASDPPLYFRRNEPSPESRASGNGRADSAEHQRFHCKHSQSDGAHLVRGSRNFERKSKVKEADEAATKRSKKILIKIPLRKDKLDGEIPPEELPKIDEKNEADELPEEEEKINSNTDQETKIWNLRPRKPIWSSLTNNGPSTPDNNKGQSPSRNPSNRSGKNGHGGEKKVKRKLSVFLSLTKEEIVEDIFSLTGSKPARRPKKRAKNLQRQLNTLFPGAWLISITADSYKVSENSLKG